MIDDNNTNTVENGDVQELRLHGKHALANLFGQHRERLRRMLQLRMDRRMRGRIDTSDVLQEAYLDASKRLNEYLKAPPMDFYIWLRLLTGQKLVALHRYHLGAQLRDASLEVSIHRGALPQATSMSLAAQLLGSLTSPSRAFARAELQIRVQQALDEMEEVDREIIALRHFEEFTNNQVAEILGLKKAAASNRYVRAMKRLKETVAINSETHY